MAKGDCYGTESFSSKVFIQREQNLGETKKLPEHQVVENPLEKYKLFNIRLKRPIQLTEEDQDSLIAEAQSHLGSGYDTRN